jgi:site-specific DNA-methyltransferase (adenine-specific)
MARPELARLECLVIAAGDGWELRLGRWQDVLADVVADALIFDAPYSGATHASKARRNDGSSADGCAPGYGSLTPDDVRAIVDHWSPRCRGWMVSITDDVLAPVWRAAYRSAGRYAFCAIPCVITGMTCRMRGDGPSSWAVYAMVGRPKTSAFASWGTLPGAYVGPRSAESKGGRGKPQWLPDALVRDYTRPGDLVVDPFAGWATTLLAAVHSGRRAIGAELDREVFDKAVAAMHRPPPGDACAIGGAARTRRSRTDRARSGGARRAGGASDQHHNQRRGQTT